MCGVETNLKNTRPKPQKFALDINSNYYFYIKNIHVYHLTNI